MFTHRGKSRTYWHNLQLAALLSFVAGAVNVISFFAVRQLTTNVTGHFAFFADELIQKHQSTAFQYLFFIACFLGGAFTSSVLIEWLGHYHKRFNSLVPAVIEWLLLLAVALCKPHWLQLYGSFIAGCLLFAMGLQNALVTSISNSVVRTTHLTGLFTDLGVELGQWLFYKAPEQRLQLQQSIRLRLAIIVCFFVGCVAGGYGYFMVHVRAMLLPVVVLGGALIWDTFRLHWLARKRK